MPPAKSIPLNFAFFLIISNPSQIVGRDIVSKGKDSLTEIRIISSISLVLEVRTNSHIVTIWYIQVSLATEAGLWKEASSLYSHYLCATPQGSMMFLNTVMGNL